MNHQKTAFNPYSANLRDWDKGGNYTEKLFSLVFSHRGVECWRGMGLQHYVYVKEGIVLGQRAGYGESFIDTFLDGSNDVARGYHDHERPLKMFNRARDFLGTI